MSDLSDNPINDEPSTRKTQPVMGPDTGVKFTSEYQPTPEARSIGQKRRYTLRELMRMTTDDFKDSKGNSYRQLAAVALGVDEESVTIEMLMDFRMMQKAVKKADTNAYKVVKEFTHGKARQIPEEPPIVQSTPNEEDQKSTFDLGNGVSFEI